MLSAKRTFFLSSDRLECSNFNQIYVLFTYVYLGCQPQTLQDEIFIRLNGSNWNGAPPFHYNIQIA